MSWTYDVTTNRGKVRYLVGDVAAGSTSVTYPTLSDAEVDYELSDAPSVQAAAANAARALAARFAQEPTDKKVGDLALSYGDRTATLLQVAKDLNADSALAAVPIAGGISIADKQTEEDDTDRVVPAFTRGMMDHPLVAPSTSVGY